MRESRLSQWRKPQQQEKPGDHRLLRNSVDRPKIDEKMPS